MDTQIQARSISATIPDIGQRQPAKPVDTRAQAVAEPVKPPRAEPTKENLELATRKVQQFVETRASELQFSIDETSGTRVVRVFDTSTKELIRQIPSQDMLDMASAIDSLQGLLLKQKA